MECLLVEMSLHLQSVGEEVAQLERSREFLEEEALEHRRLRWAAVQRVVELQAVACCALSCRCVLSGPSGPA